MNRVKKSSFVFIFLGLVFLGGLFAHAEEFYLTDEGWVEEVTADFSAGGDLAEGYIQKHLYPQRQGLLRTARPSGSRLSGADRTIYLTLREKAAALAAGTEACSIVEFPAEEVYEKITFTAEDLGVDALIVDGQVSKTANANLMEIIRETVHQKTVLNCLMADCPYEMYWYDKLVGNLMVYPKASWSPNTVTITGNLTFYLPVSADYRDAEKQPVKIQDKYERYCFIDQQWGQSVSQAVANARKIVDENESLEDYERLCAYKEEIRNLTEYNHEAAAEGVDYGNPWQLIWVFDGNPETKVVCEGFSKAFQYLNDLSSSSVTVISVTGKMGKDSEDMEGHMWNIVRMEDGQNYLADITNCYTDAQGQDVLFLDGYLSGGESGTYTYRWRDSGMTYVYDENDQIQDQADLSIADKGYLAAKPRTPVFIKEEGKDDFLIGESVAFQYQEDPETEYDSFCIKVTFTSDDGERKKVTRKGIELTEGNIWYFGPEFHEAGIYMIQFAGKRGSFTSLWSEAAVLVPEVAEDLGRIALTQDTLDSLKNVKAGDFTVLEWNAVRTDCVSGFHLEMKEAEPDGTVHLMMDYAADTTTSWVSWNVCPGEYLLSFSVKTVPGCSYTTDEDLTVRVLYSGKEWVLDGNGILTQYFGSSAKLAVPETIGGKEVAGIGAMAFEKSRAMEVTVPSTMKTDEQAFFGKEGLTVYGYTGSEAETAAEAAGAPFVSLGIKPGTPVCTASSQTGYTGYALAVRLSEDADYVLVRESKEQIPCDGRIVLIPLDSSGEKDYTLAIIRDDVRGEYGNTVHVSVFTPGNGKIVLPKKTKTIGDEAFAGMKAAVIRIPAGVNQIGRRAFANCSGLQMIELEGNILLTDAMLEGCGDVLPVVTNADAWFERETEFLTFCP